MIKKIFLTINWVKNMEVNYYFRETQNDERVFIPHSIQEELSLIDIVYITMKSSTKKFVIDKTYTEKCPVHFDGYRSSVDVNGVKNPIITGLLVLMATNEPESYYAEILIGAENYSKLFNELRSVIKKINKMIIKWNLVGTILHDIYRKLVDNDSSLLYDENDWNEFCELVCPPIYHTKSARNI
jgi:hypothetical protein